MGHGLGVHIENTKQSVEKRGAIYTLRARMHAAIWCLFPMYSCSVVKKLQPCSMLASCDLTQTCVSPVAQIRHADCVCSLPVVVRSL